MPVDAEKANELSCCVLELCTSGEPKLDGKKLRQLKRLCKLSDGYVLHCYHVVLQQLERNHAEIRLSALQIIEELFSRSHCFREALLQDFQYFLELTLEINPAKPLPAPDSAAKALKKSSYTAVKAWHKDFASGYKKLDIAYNYLKSCHKVDFNASELVPAVQRRRAEEQQRRQTQQTLDRLQRATAEAEEGMRDLQPRITELNECLQLLLPKSSSMCDGVSGAITYQRLSVVESSDNADVVRAFLEARKLTCSGKYAETLTRWLSVLQKNGAGVALLQRLIDMKTSLQETVVRAQSVRVKRPTDDSDSEDESFVEVPMAELSEQDYLVQRIQQRLQAGLDDNALPHVGRAAAGCAGSSVAALLSSHVSRDPTVQTTPRNGNAPIVPFDLDIEYWDNPHALRIPEPVPIDTPSRFWLPKDDSGCSVTEVAHELYRTRTIEFSGMFVPVERACGAPLPNGKLCNRMDRFKCPFHGKIIARNPDGTPAAGETSIDATKQGHAAVPEWQDPTLLAEIKAATGLDLKVQKGKKRSKASTTSKLTNIKAVSQTSRSRLERKVLNRSAVQRVAEAMDTLDSTRHKDKFCHTFVSTFSQ